jgi:hypothetical protein
MSRLNDHYTTLGADVRQFYMASEPVSYVADTGATVNLKACVNRDAQNPIIDQRADGAFEIQRATLDILPRVDVTYGGIVLDTADKIKAFRGRNFSIAVREGEALVPDWIVHQITGSGGTWSISVAREKRIETGKTRRGA